MRVRVAALALVLVAAGAAVAPAAMSQGDPTWKDRNWVGAWGVPPATANYPAAAEQSFRMIVHPTIGGDAVRLRFSNAFGESPLDLRSVSVAVRRSGAEIDPDMQRLVTFGGRHEVTVEPHGLVISDPVRFPYAYGTDVAVSFYVPGAVPRVTGHGFTAEVVTSYLTPPGVGDTTTDATGDSFSVTTGNKYFLMGLDAYVPGALGTVVAFGDSITDGTGSTTDGYDTWPDLLGARLQAQGIKLGVINDGIGGNTVLPCHMSAVFGQAAVDRFDRDVLQHPNVRAVIFNQGGNDLRYCPVTATEVAGGLASLVERTRRAGIAAVMTTYIPRVSRTVVLPNLSPDAAGDDQRQMLNRWIRENATTFDGFIDFDAVIRDPQNPNQQDPKAGSAPVDQIHPGPSGYRMMADAVPLDLLTRLARPGNRG